MPRAAPSRGDEDSACGRAGHGPSCTPAAASRSLRCPSRQKPAGRASQTRTVAFLHVSPGPDFPRTSAATRPREGGVFSPRVAGEKAKPRRGSCDQEGHGTKTARFPWPVCGSGFLASPRTATAEQVTGGHGEVAGDGLGPFTLSPRPRGRGRRPGTGPCRSLVFRATACAPLPARASVSPSVRGGYERPDPAARSPPGTPF